MPHGPNVTSMHRIECQRLLLADDAHHFAGHLDWCGLLLHGFNA